MGPDDDIPHDDIPLMRIRRSLALSTGASSPAKTRTESSLGDPMALMRGPFLTSDISPSPTSTQQAKTPEQALKKQLAELRKDLHSEQEEKRRVKRLRAKERKEIGELKQERRELRIRLEEKHAQLNDGDFKYDQEKQQLGTLHETDELARGLWAPEKNPGTHKMDLMQQLREKDQEIERLKAENAANNDGAVQDLMKRLESEIVKRQAAGAPSPTKAQRGVDVGTQTEEDGLAEKLTALKRMLG
jgi:hypothetical protein